MSTDAKHNAIADIRRDNLRKLMAEHSASKLSAMLGYKQSSFLSQMAGPNPTREVTEKTVRAFEKQLGLSLGALDKPLTDTGTPAAMTAAEMMALMLSVTCTVGEVCAAGDISLPPGKLTNVIEMAAIDALEHKNQVRESYVKQILALVN